MRTALAAIGAVLVIASIWLFIGTAEGNLDFAPGLVGGILTVVVGFFLLVMADRD